LTTLIAQGRPDVIVIGRETYARYVPTSPRVRSLSADHSRGITHGVIDGTHPRISRNV